MALKNGKVNKLNTLGLRKVNFPAHHFYYTSVPRFNPSFLKRLDTWIYSNLNHRYYIGQSVELIDNTIVFVTKIGFEQEKELSFFKLACSDIS